MMWAAPSFDERAAVPVNNLDPVVPSKQTKMPYCAPGGTFFYIADAKPDDEAPMHRNNYLGYVVIASG